MFRDNIVAACWRLTDLSFGDIRMRKCIVDVKPFCCETPLQILEIVIWENLYIIMLVHSRYELSVDGQSVSHTSVVFLVHSRYELSVDGQFGSYTSVVFLCLLLYVFVRSVDKVG